MYLKHFSLNTMPFDLLPDPRFLYLGKNHDMALTSLRYGIESGAGFLVITGDIGIGKTTLIRTMLNYLTNDHQVGLVTNTHKDFGSLLEWILLAYSLDHRGMSEMERYELLTEFLVENYAKGKHAVLIIDEAQNLDVNSLEKLRVISNLNSDHHKILQVILAGQPEFLDTLRLPELRQFAQRVAVGFHIKPLTPEDTEAYINHRLKVAGAEQPIFTAEACQKVAEYTKGVPRLINMLCNNALVFAFADRKDWVSLDIMNSVIDTTKEIGLLPFEHNL